MTGPENKQSAAKLDKYSSPTFERHDLATITLGGSPGSGDSGNSSAERPFGENPAEFRDEKSFEEGWDNEV